MRGTKGIAAGAFAFFLAIGMCVGASASTTPETAAAFKAVAAGKYQKAIQSFSSLNLNDGIFHSRIGFAYGKLGDRSKAIEHYARAAKICPQTKGFWNNLA